MWASLLSEFEVTGEITYPPAACRQLARYETELGRLLPSSYKEYCSVFGPGELISPFRYLISAPGPETWKERAEARVMHEDGKEANIEWPHYVKSDLDAERLTNALFFSSDISSYFYFWNTGEVTSTEKNEYAIYVIKRACDVYRLCDSFSEFVTEICMKKGVPGDSPRTEREKVFRPVTVSERVPPIAVSSEWLTSTVRTLVKGIQEDGAFDRMPILADALQDAGCDNEEILGHCRHPGGHVRGCFVIDLLTGRK